MQAPCSIQGQQDAETLWFAGELCRTCGQPATHYVIRNVRPDRWIDQRWMRVLAVPYCVACSPVISDGEKDYLLAKVQKRGFFARWLRRKAELIPA